MHNNFNRTKLLVGLCLMGLTLLGCKESEPSNYQQNMGVDGAPLLSVGNARTVAAVATGQAEWIEFRDPSKAAQEPADTDEDKPADNSEIEQEIRDLVKDYNDVVVDRDIDETLDFFIEAQQDVVKPVLISMFKVADELAKQREAISTQLPDAADRIDMAFSKLGSAAQAKLEVTSIEVIDDGQVNGTLGSGSLAASCRFVLEDDAWYIEFDTEGLTARTTLITLEKLLTSIEGSTSSGEELLVIVENAMASHDEAADDEPTAD